MDICSKYLECRGGRFVLRQCVEGSVFDDVREACVPSFLEKTECHRKCSFVERRPLRGSPSKYVYCEKGVVKIGFCKNFFNMYTGKCEQRYTDYLIDVNSRDDQTKLSSLGLDSKCSPGSRRRNSCSEYLECDSTSTWARRRCSESQHFDPTAMECVPAWMHFCDDQKYESTSVPTDFWSSFDTSSSISSTPLNEGSTSETSSSDGSTSESSQSQWPTTESSPTEAPTSESSPSDGPTSESSPSDGPTSESSPSDGPTSESSPSDGPTSESSPSDGPTSESPPTAEPTSTEGPITSPSVEPTNTPSSYTPRTDQPTDEPSSEMPSSTTVLTTITMKPTTKTTKATTTKGPQCTEGKKKLMAGDCKHYLECKSGLWTKQTCIFGFDFDVNKLRCVFSWWATC